MFFIEGTIPLNCSLFGKIFVLLKRTLPRNIAAFCVYDLFTLHIRIIFFLSSLQLYCLIGIEGTHLKPVRSASGAVSIQGKIRPRFVYSSNYVH